MRRRSSVIHRIVIVLAIVLGVLPELMPATEAGAAPVVSAHTTTVASTPSPEGRIAPKPARFTATFNSIGIEVPFTGDPNADATGAIMMRRRDETVWRTGLPLWHTADASGSAFYGSILLLSPGAQYEVKITIADPDGIDGEPVQTSFVSTRAEISVPAVTPTHYVRANGNDLAEGRSAATAWKTIDKAMQAAPSGAVVEVGPGYFPTSRSRVGLSGTSRSTPITLIAQYPALDATRQPINPNQRSVIVPVGQSSPSGESYEPNPGVWQQVTLTGPRSGAPFTVWKWAASPISDAGQLGYAPTRTAAPIRVAHWKKDATDLATAAGWAEKVYTNLTYRYGFFADGADVYLRLPGDRDPNHQYVTLSGYNQVGISINAPGSRVSGFEIRQFANGIEIMSGGRQTLVERNLLTGNMIGVSFRGASPSTYGSDHVVQDNLIQDSALWSPAPTPDGTTIPWTFIKSRIRNADGTDYSTSKVGGQSEGAGISGRGGALRVVVRRNTIDGPFNGVGTGYNDGYDRYAAQDMDVYDNVIRHIADDALEPEQTAINFRAWNNRIDETLTVLSAGPVNFGPIYLFRNTAWRTGTDGSGGDMQARLPGSTMLKYSGTSTTTARLYVLHNTFWTDRPVATVGAQFASSGAASEALYLRNNLFRATSSAFDAPAGAGAWNEDANYFLTTNPMRGLRFNGVTYRADVSAYRVASGQGARTNVAIGFSGDVPLVNPASGDLRLPSDSPLVNAGVRVPNLSDRLGVDFQGAGPDIGYERR